MFGDSSWKYKLGGHARALSAFWIVKFKWNLRVWLLCKTGFVIRKKGCLVTHNCKQVSIKRWSFEIPLKISLLWMIFLSRLLRRQISASQLMLEKGLNQMLAKSFRQKNVWFGTQYQDFALNWLTTEFKQTQDWLSWIPSSVRRPLKRVVLVSWCKIVKRRLASG